MKLPNRPTLVVSGKEMSTPLPPRKPSGLLAVIDTTNNVFYSASLPFYLAALIW